MRQFALSLLLGSAVVLSGCSDPVLEQRVADLEEQVAELETEVEEAAKAGPARRDRGPSSADEEKAAALLRSANTAVASMDYDEAKSKLEELNDKYPSTRAARSSRRLSSELSVIGTDAGSLEVEKWYQGETSMDAGEATLLVFWEVWCPHCRREVPAMQATWEKYQDDGLNMVGLTKITKSATEDKVTSFIDEQGLTYPMAKEGGTLSARFGVRGIPAAAVVKDGKVVWRGHPARLNDKMFETWLGTSGEG